MSVTLQISLYVLLLLLMTTLLVPGSLFILGPCITCWSPLRDSLCMSHDADLHHYWPYLAVCCWCCLVGKLCLILLRPRGLEAACYSVHGISQSRLLEWFAISFSRESSQLQGSNLCLLHWQVDSLPLSYQGSQSYSLGAAYSLFVFPLNGAFLCLTSDLPRINSSLHCLDTVVFAHFSLSGQYYIIFLFLCQNIFKKFL